jgi:hypothetical protein
VNAASFTVYPWPFAATNTGVGFERLALLGAGFLLALYLLAVTVRRYGAISRAARVAGIGPSVLLAATLVGLLAILRY